MSKNMDGDMCRLIEMRDKLKRDKEYKKEMDGKDCCRRIVSALNKIVHDQQIENGAMLTNFMSFPDWNKFVENKGCEEYNKIINKFEKNNIKIMTQTTHLDIRRGDLYLNLDLKLNYFSTYCIHSFRQNYEEIE